MKLKKLISAMAAASVLSGCMAVVPVSAESSEPVVNVTFDDGGDGYDLINGASLVSGRSGKALSLDGTDDHAVLTGAADKIKQLTGDFTISVWFNPSEIQWWQRVFDLGTGTDVYTFLSLGNPRFAMKNGIEQSFDSNTPITVGQWQNVTITRSGSTTDFWLDGFKTGSTTGISYQFSDLAEFTQCYLGKSQWPDPYYKGMIDDFKVYDRALSEGEIQTIADEAYKTKRYEKAYEDNCYTATTKFYSGENEIFAYESGSVRAVVNVENNTAGSNEISAALYAVSGENETKLSDDVKASPASLEAAELVLNASADVPAGADKLIVKLNTGSADEIAATLYAGIKAPVAAPADSDSTTIGAHDPSIVKFPGDDTYYVYSSHHLLFTSKDLINWKKYDFTNINAKDMSPKTYSFINRNYPKTTWDGQPNVMNGTYWAPDVIYVPDRDAEHPYWMYISLSCGLGGMNSAISLVKSNNPLFWADKNSDIVDAGVVYATKDGSGKTNAIDANIYIDTDGTYYFLWGSFWGGIQAVKLKDDGFAEGVDYSSEAKILSSSKNLGTSIFTQKRGVAGPEGGWMINHGYYRYVFGSYAWLGSNYNTRVVRSPLSTSFGTNTGTQMLDANGVVMGTQYSRSTGAVKPSEITGYKLIGSYRLGDGTDTVKENDVNDWYYPRESGDAHVYYGPGHNSVINIDDETFYVSHTRKDNVEGAATLQVRKTLFTSDGWPVVSPVTYAGEVEQALPEEMLYGTYDLASVGVTKFAPGDDAAINENFNNHSGNRNYDLPVISSKVTLNADHTMADGLGSWAFDGDHTVTLTFAKDGDTTKDEFYKSGDVMTLYALFGYDKDEREPVIGLTGTDQKHITQLAKKSMAEAYKTEPVKVSSDPVSISKSAGGNPELGFDQNGNILYAGDPAATVIGDTVYLICGHDTSADEGYVMPEWVLYTSKDMTNWEYKGVVMKATDISWRNTDTDAWASQMTEYNGKYYLYFCTWDKTSSGKQSIGVAVADKPEGPYKDALGKPLVAGTFTTPESSGWNDIDPTVLIDNVDGVEHRYLAWGNGKYYICELNEDMISVKDIDGDGQIIMHKDVKERSIKSMGNGVYTEAPWLYKRDGKYYLFYAMNWREEMAYAMCDEPMGRYDFKQIIMPPTATSNTNHPSVIDFNGKTYFIYHNGALPHGSGFRRSVCIDELNFDENGYVYPVTETSIGLTGTASTLKSISGAYVGHPAFTNSLADGDYPIRASLTAAKAEDGYNTAWEIMPAKYVPDGDNAGNYVSIQSVNKPGLYIASTGTGLTLTQDAAGTSGNIMTFRTVKGLDGNENTVSFESVTDEGKYLTVLGSKATLSYGTVAEDCSFTIAEAAEKDIPVINTAIPDPEPDPDADTYIDFDDLPTGTLISFNATDTMYAGIEGITLYMGTRSSDAQPKQNFAIQTGGESGNALVLNTGKYQSTSRGPRMQVATPTIPNGYTATLSIRVKQGTAGSVLRYNDSTTTESGTNISGLTTGWQTLLVAITNDNDTYSRVIRLGENEIASDYAGTFPVLWGTVDNNSGQSIFFDTIVVKTTKDEQPEPTGKLALTYDNGKAVITGMTEVESGTRLIEAVYNNGALTGVKLHDIADATQPIELSYSPTDGTLRLMLWTGMKPILPAIIAE